MSRKVVKLGKKLTESFVKIEKSDRKKANFRKIEKKTRKPVKIKKIAIKILKN